MDHTCKANARPTNPSVGLVWHSTAILADRKELERPTFGQFRSWMDTWYAKTSDYAHQNIASNMRCYRVRSFLGFRFKIRIRPTRQDVYIQSEFLKVKARSKAQYPRSALPSAPMFIAR